MLSRIVRPTTKSILKSTTCSLCHTRLAHKLVEVELVEDVLNLGFKGERIPVAPGRARNVLIPQGKALLVTNRGKTVSTLNDMLRREEGLSFKINSRIINSVGSSSTSSDVDEPLAPQKVSETTLFNSLSTLPILTFYRIPNPTTSSTSTSPSTSSTSSLPGQKSSTSKANASKELFGSVSSSDLISKIAEYGILIEEGVGKLVNNKGDEIEKGRIKSLGKYQLIVDFKLIKESVSIDIEVLAEV